MLSRKYKKINMVDKIQFFCLYFQQSFHNYLLFFNLSLHNPKLLNPNIILIINIAVYFFMSNITIVNEAISCASFCGCQLYNFKDEAGNIQSVGSKVYVCIFIMIVLTTISLRTGTQWFIFKDYYPLKQRSPILCITMIGFLALQIMLYPALYVYNFFTTGFQESQNLYRMLWYGLDGAIYFVYLVRSLRLIYAHTTDVTRQNTIIFKLFKHEYLLGLICAALLLLRIIPVYFNPDPQNYSFKTMIQFSSPYSRFDEVPFLVKSLVSQLVWIFILMYCLYLQRYTHLKYSMQNQLIFVIGLSLILNLAQWVFINQQMDELSLFFGLCTFFRYYPIVQIFKNISLVGMFIYSGIIPLLQKKIYHTLLPTGRNYGLTKTMRDFLIEPQFLKIFTKFLQYMDAQQNSTRHLNLLERWKKLMVLKYCQNKEQQDKIAEIKKILFQKQSYSPSEIKSPLILGLKRSIESFQSVNQSASEQLKLKHRQDINQKVDQLQQMFLQKLDRLYKEQYHKTKSYYHLKTKLNSYKKVNINMILLRMALMVESDNDSQ